ncbi:hypothetical protein HMPREF7215_2216 [Pyramidobacter piscolens W5455]|uniref:Uncharacterized protein n=1 Tax=Pyramidobacter piscolens W5455 TaxID=352165 RepID=A0ABM9ZRA5_9BACT|nr:hypothetical protein HMPREF7215_2216 [Pyramidobacter piscolens W5455]
MTDASPEEENAAAALRSATAAFFMGTIRTKPSGNRDGKTPKKAIILQKFLSEKVCEEDRLFGMMQRDSS